MTQRCESRIKQNHPTLDDRMPEIVYTNPRMAFYPNKFGQKQRVFVRRGKKREEQEKRQRGIRTSRNVYRYSWIETDGPRDVIRKNRAPFEISIIDSR